MCIEFKPIGVIHSPFKNPQDIVRERNTDPEGFADVKGEIEIHPEFAAGLDDIDGFSHLIVVFIFHEAAEARLTAHPPYDQKERGVFATRSPHRPNPIGVTVVQLEGRIKNRLSVTELDMVEGTPVLDIKPYTQRDRKENIRLGWLTPFQKAR